MQNRIEKVPKSILENNVTFEKKKLNLENGDQNWRKSYIEKKNKSENNLLNQKEALNWKQIHTFTIPVYISMLSKIFAYLHEQNMNVNKTISKAVNVKQKLPLITLKKSKHMHLK